VGPAVPLAGRNPVESGNQLNVDLLKVDTRQQLGTDLLNIDTLWVLVGSHQ
jgi:hypothetical protein